MSGAILHILQHSLGVDQYGMGKQYRNYFMTDEGSTDHPLCMAAVKLGLMRVRRSADWLDSMDIFRVTDTGKEYVALHSPPPPKLTRGQRRYRAWLDADSPMPFGEWIKSEWGKAA